MSEQVKQSSIYKEIFQFITERKKLEIIIYNKKMQNILHIGLVNYQFKSGKYKGILIK